MTLKYQGSITRIKIRWHFMYRSKQTGTLFFKMVYLNWSERSFRKTISIQSNFYLQLLTFQFCYCYQTKKKKYTNHLEIIQKKLFYFSFENCFQCLRFLLCMVIIVTMWIHEYNLLGFLKKNQLPGEINQFYLFKKNNEI